MRIFNSLSIIGALVLTVGCGSSSDSNSGTTNGGTGTATGGTNAGGGNGGAASTEACNLPACLTGAMGSCSPSGNCTQSTDANGATNKCYDNGIKTALLVDSVSGALSITVNNASGNCYSVQGPLDALEFKDGSGNVIATGAFVLATQSLTVACSGEQPVVVNSACDSVTSALDPFAGTTCSAGTCTL